jgi:hypothetical protein
MEYNFQSWPFEDAESQPLLGYCWTRITNVMGTITGCYMTSSNAFDCITSTQVQQHLSICPIYLHVTYLVVLTSVKNLQVTWQPYKTNVVQDMGLNAICMHDQDLWTALLPLICYYIVEWHLPIRVVRQFGGLQTVAVQHEVMS